MSGQRILFSIHSWVNDAPHDVLLRQALPAWRIESITRFPYDPALTSRQHLEGWVAAASAAITSAEPHGPLHLIGYSFGGRMAYLVANHLREQGRTIEYCGVIDMLGEWPSLHPASLRRLLFLMRANPSIASWSNLIRRGPISRIRWRLSWGLSRFIPRSRRAAILEAKPHGEVTRYLNPSIALVWQLSSIIRLNKSTMPITLFVTQASIDLYKSQDLLWGPIIGKPVTIIPIPGIHTTVFDEEHFDSLARAIEQSLPAANE